jgi:hypothetical protein
MQIHRDKFQGFDHSPDCQLYGKKLYTSNGKLPCLCVPCSSNLKISKYKLLI